MANKAQVSKVLREAGFRRGKRGSGTYKSPTVYGFEIKDNGNGNVYVSDVGGNDFRVREYMLALTERGLKASLSRDVHSGEDAVFVYGK